MKKILLSATLAFTALAGAQAYAQDKPIFALVPKAMDNPFYDQALAGCKKAAEDAGGAFECEYIGPGQHGGGDEQVQIVQDLVAKRVAGIAVSPSNAVAILPALQAAKEAGIPVITCDSDVLPENKDLRVAYIGTHNYEIGINIAKILQTIKPKGGVICIQSAARRRPTSTSVCRASVTASPARSRAASPGDPLTGQNGWTEAEGCPLYTNDDFPLAVQQFQDLLTKMPNLDAFAATGGFAQFVPDANRAATEPFKDKIAKNELALVYADTLPTQIDQMKEGLSPGQVGQRPYRDGLQVHDWR